jgi:hypothetical protein
VAKWGRRCIEGLGIPRRSGALRRTRVVPWTYLDSSAASVRPWPSCPPRSPGCIELVPVGLDPWAPRALLVGECRRVVAQRCRVWARLETMDGGPLISHGAVQIRLSMTVSLGSMRIVDPVITGRDWS